jgi:ArsR family transcriptional regulator, arsenate/arsenite/antimonite-responsive transcriptional repressor
MENAAYSDVSPALDEDFTPAAVQALGALAQESRLAIFRLLVQAGASGKAAGEIGADLKLAPATLSFHLKELNLAGLIVAKQQGRFIFYSAHYARMTALLKFLTENCCAGDAVPCATPHHAVTCC